MRGPTWSRICWYQNSRYQTGLWYALISCSLFSYDYQYHHYNLQLDAILNKINNGGLKTNSVDLDDDEDGGTDSTQDLEGSADQPLDF